MEFLDAITSAIKGKPKYDSSGDLKRLQEEQARTKATPQQEREAKAAGFKSHAEFMAYARQRQNKAGGSVKGKPKSADPSVMHPAVLLDYVSQAVKGATEGKKP